MNYLSVTTPAFYRGSLYICNSCRIRALPSQALIRRKHTGNAVQGAKTKGKPPQSSQNKKVGDANEVASLKAGVHNRVRREISNKHENTHTKSPGVTKDSKHPPKGNGPNSKHGKQLHKSQTKPATTSKARASKPPSQPLIRSKKAKPAAEVKTLDAKRMELRAIDVEQPPVPRLAHGLDRVLFNQGIYQLQDPRSRVYNFDPALEKIMPVAEFDYDALNEYITSSRDHNLREIAQETAKKYTGSTSSMTGVLAHFHFLLSQWRPVDTSRLSKNFPDVHKTFTEINRSPSAIFLRWKDGHYAIDADKQFASTSVLSMLGRSMEKLLTLDMGTYDKYRKSNDEEAPNDGPKCESYHYTTLGDFLMRSQLDAYDPRLPGTGMFDLKTRATVSVRMDVKNVEEAAGYQIKDRFGAYESYEREYYDMMRSALLKYSLQVRMGRMDGIFVAYHNVERIFGFQYISLPEIDSIIHGQQNPCLGDQEFMYSVALLNEAFNKATKKFPGTSIRFFVEAREAVTPFLYIFAEPMTEAEVDDIQSRKDEEIAAFERNVLGHDPRRRRQELKKSTDDDGRWDDMEANVENSMSNDERGLDAVADITKEENSLVDVAEADTGLNDVISHETDEEYVDTTNGDMKEAENQDALPSELADPIGEEDPSESNDSIEANNSSEIDFFEPLSSADQLTETSIDQLLHSNMESSSVEGPVEGSIELVQTSVDTDTNVPFDAINAFAGLGVTQLGQSPADTEAVNSSSSFSLESIERLTSPQVTLPDAETSSQPTSSQVAPPKGSGNGENQAGQKPLLAMTLTVRNRINDSYSACPWDLKSEDDWKVEYTLSEVEDQARAWTLYKMCQARRSKKLERDEDADQVNYYIRLLRKMNEKGRQWRMKLDANDRGKPIQMVWDKDTDGNPVSPPL